jgi:pseudouridine synthase
MTNVFSKLRRNDFLGLLLLFQCGLFISDAFLITDERQPQQCRRNISPLFLASTRTRQISANSAEDDFRPGIRLNKVFKATHSRRQADELISSGRVTVNGNPVSAGQRVHPFQDEIFLDGKRIEDWESLNGIVPQHDDGNTNEPRPEQTTFEYTKYWKPTGVICTTDRRIPNNIIDALLDSGYTSQNRVYPVGRLDRETSGLILLTSDGRLPNAALRGENKQPKTYHVTVNKALKDSDLRQLQQGVVITTVAQRDGRRPPPLTAKTKPCQIERVNQKSVFLTITEGRNRQVRKMMGAVGFDVMKLERVSFAGLGLFPLQRPGDWGRLDEEEMKVINSILRSAGAAR